MSFYTFAYRVLVTGGRDYRNRRAVFFALTDVWHAHRPLIVIEGGARGADELAREWCELGYSGVEHIRENAEWSRFGPAAGIVRNQKMLRDHKPHLILAFPGGRGTRDMVNKARQAGVRVEYGEELARV